MAAWHEKFLNELAKSIPSLFGARSRMVASAPEAMAVPAVATKSAIANTKFIRSGPSHSNRIALTFDDGPVPGVTNRILDQLKERNLHATFFMMGRRLAAAPDLGRRVLAEGHNVGNHTYTHPNLTTLPDHQVEEEIQKTQDLMAGVLHYRPTWFRPPYGALRADQAGIVAKQGLEIVLWNVDPEDWAQPGEAKIVGTILAETESGSIIICHDLFAQTAGCLGSILDGLAERGFSFVTLSEFLE